jgi:putative membrane protein
MVLALSTLLAIVIGTWAELQPLSRHMVVHVVLMNGVAPTLAVPLAGSGFFGNAGAGQLACATGFQLLALWGWHTPAALVLGHASPAIHLLALAVLSAAALWFWIAVLSQDGTARWCSILVLLVTGKLFCLLGVILTFAPRHLYPGLASAHGHVHGLALADQQLAGLIMLAACPATYVLAGAVITVRWLDELPGDER